MLPSLTLCWLLYPASPAHPHHSLTLQLWSKAFKQKLQEAELALASHSAASTPTYPRLDVHAPIAPMASGWVHPTDGHSARGFGWDQPHHVGSNGMAPTASGLNKVQSISQKVARQMPDLTNPRLLDGPDPQEQQGPPGGGRSGSVKLGKMPDLSDPSLLDEDGGTKKKKGGLRKLFG